MMSKSLDIVQVMVYYDEPHVFISEDLIKTKYLCLLVDSEGIETTHIAVPISAERLSKLKMGTEDLRNVFEHPETEERYSLYFFEDNIEATTWKDKTYPDEYLPERGFDFGHDFNKEDESIVRESTRRGNIVSRLKIEDGTGKEGVRVNDVGNVLSLFQSVIGCGHKKYASSGKAKDKSVINPRNFEFRADYAMAGSLIVNMFSESSIDVFGQADGEFGLKVFDAISIDFTDRDKYIESLKRYKGHTLSALKKLSKAIIESNIVITNKWTSPSASEVFTTRISPDKAETIINILNLSDELTEEIIEFLGVFKQVDVTNKTWRIFNEKDGCEYSGTVADDSMLKGVDVDKTRYKVVCEDILEEVRISEKVKHRYTIKAIEPSNEDNIN